MVTMVNMILIEMVRVVNVNNLRQGVVSPTQRVFRRPPGCDFAVCTRPARQPHMMLGSAGAQLGGLVMNANSYNRNSYSHRRQELNDVLDLGVQLKASCRGADVFLIQPLVPPVQEHLMELLLMLDAVIPLAQRSLPRRARH